MSTLEPRAALEKIQAHLQAARVDEAVALSVRTIEDLVAAEAVRSATTVLAHLAAPLVAAGHWSTVVALLDTVLDAASTRTHPQTRGRLLAIRAGVLRTPRRFTEALADQNEAIELLADRAPEDVVTTLGHDRAVLLADLGRADEAVTGFVAAREAFLGIRDRVGVAACDHNLGFVLHDLGALDDAAEYLTEARDIFLAIDMPEEAASCDQNLGVIFYDANRLAEAGRRFAVARHRFAECDARHSAAECDANISTLLTTMGRTDEAARYRLRAEDAGVGIPSPPGTSTQQPAVVADAASEDQLPSRAGTASA